MTNRPEPVPQETDRIAREVVDAAYAVHRNLGPGLLESVYEACLCYELGKRGIPFRSQVPLPVQYERVRIEAGLRLDVLAAECVVVELKAAEKNNPLYEAQLLTYLKLTGIRVGLLINFNVLLIKDGIQRMAL